MRQLVHLKAVTLFKILAAQPAVFLCTISVSDSLQFLPVDSMLDFKLPYPFKFMSKLDDIRSVSLQLVHISAVFVNPVGLFGHIGTVLALVRFHFEMEGPIVHSEMGVRFEPAATKLALALLFRLVYKLNVPVEDDFAGKCIAANGTHEFVRFLQLVRFVDVSFEG